MIKGEVGDLKNLGGRTAGSITAGWFLAAFVGEYPLATSTSPAPPGSTTDEAVPVQGWHGRRGPPRGRVPPHPHRHPDLTSPRPARPKCAGRRLRERHGVRTCVR